MLALQTCILSNTPREQVTSRGSIMDEAALVWHVGISIFRCIASADKTQKASANNINILRRSLLLHTTVACNLLTTVVCRKG